MTNSGKNFKALLVGSSGVGKTAIVRRLINGSFSDSTTSTVGVEFHTFVETVDDNDILIDLWDTAGQERYRSISKAYFRGAVAAAVVYSIDDRRSFEDIEEWLNDFHTLSMPNSIAILVGNKSDKEEDRKVSIQEAAEFASRHRMEFLETSALEGTGITETFHRIAVLIRDGVSRGEIKAIPGASMPHETEQKTEDESGWSCC